MKQESIDTNVLLRFTLSDIPAQYRSAKKLILESDKSFFVSDVAIMEYVFSLESYYQKNRLEIAEMIGYLMSLPQLNLNNKLFQSAIAIYTEHPKLSFDDCYLACAAGEAEAVPLWTFDRKLANQSDVAKLVK